MKPILFNTEMVRAILEGRKTVTRRVINRDIADWCDKEKDGTLLSYENSYGDFINPVDLCRYKVNDILYVRETWYKDVSRVLYKANYNENEKFYQNGKEILVKWKPSIHMPKEVARIFLRVTGVRVERLQDMKKEDCEREGIRAYIKDEKLYKYAVSIDWWEAFHYKYRKLFKRNWWQDMPRTAREAFHYLWDSTIKKDQLQYYGWNANPYVWVIEFERVDRP